MPLLFGQNKYSSLHLMFARWLSKHSIADGLCYVTLGGTEIKDIHSLFFIAKDSIDPAYSFVGNEDHYTEALTTKANLRTHGIEVDVINDDIYSYSRDSRNSDKPHLFYLDGCGRFAFSDHDIKIAEMFSSSTIKEGDTLIITSYMGRHPGWKKIFDEYESEYRILGITGTEEKKSIFRRAHPAMTLYRALTRHNLASDLKVSCFGCIKYRDTSPMGLFGYQVEKGSTSLSSLIDSANITYFDSKSGYINSDINF